MLLRRCPTTRPLLRATFPSATTDGQRAAPAAACVLRQEVCSQTRLLSMQLNAAAPAAGHHCAFEEATSFSGVRKRRSAAQGLWLQQQAHCRVAGTVLRVSVVGAAAGSWIAKA